VSNLMTLITTFYRQNLILLSQIATFAINKAFHWT